MMAPDEQVELVREYFDAWRREGLEGYLSLVPDDVEFVPYGSGGRRLAGKAPLRDFWDATAARGERVEVDDFELEALDEDNVLVAGTLVRHAPGSRSTDQVAWLYSFRDGRLWRASAHASAREAREVARFLHSDRVQLSRRGPNFALTLQEAPGGRTVLRVAGEVDVGTAGDLAEAIDRASRSGHVLVDLSGLEFIDSSGLRAFIEASRAAEAGGWTLEVRRARPSVHRVFEISGMEQLLRFVD